MWETSYPEDGCTQSNEIAPGIFDRVFPLPTKLVRPLAGFNPPPAPEVDVSAKEDEPADER